VPRGAGDGEMRADVGERQRGCGPQHDEGAYPFSVAGIRCCHDSGFGYRLVLGKDVLDQFRGQVLPAADDEVFSAVADREVAVGVEDADVTGAKPAAG
jgi:hypothetical protein